MDRATRANYIVAELQQLWRQRQDIERREAELTAELAAPPEDDGGIVLDQDETRELMRILAAPPRRIPRLAAIMRGEPFNAPMPPRDIKRDPLPPPPSPAEKAARRAADKPAKQGPPSGMTKHERKQALAAARERKTAAAAEGVTASLREAVTGAVKAMAGATFGGATFGPNAVAEAIGKPEARDAVFFVLKEMAEEGTIRRLRARQFLAPVGEGEDALDQQTQPLGDDSTLPTSDDLADMLGD